MPTRSLHLAYGLPVARDVVADHLADAQSWVGLSPLVVDVRDVRLVDGVTHYVAVERVPLVGPLHWDNLIRVSLAREEQDAATIVFGRVDSPGAVTLDYRYVLTDAADSGAGGTHVDEGLELRAPLGLTRFAASRAGAVQAGRPAMLAGRFAE